MIILLYGHFKISRHVILRCHDFRIFSGRIHTFKPQKLYFKISEFSLYHDDKYIYFSFHLDKVESESPIVVHKTNNQTTKTANINPSNQAGTAKINPTHQAVEQDVDDPSPAQGNSF